MLIAFIPYKKKIIFMNINFLFYVLLKFMFLDLLRGGRCLLLLNGVLLTQEITDEIILGSID